MATKGTNGASRATYAQAAALILERASLDLRALAESVDGAVVDATRASLIAAAEFVDVIRGALELDIALTLRLGWLRPFGWRSLDVTVIDDVDAETIAADGLDATAARRVLPPLRHAVPQVRRNGNT